MDFRADTRYSGFTRQIMKPLCLSYRTLLQSGSILLFLGFSAQLQAEVKLPAIFGDHMVLQRDTTVPIWGTAAPGESVTVTAGDARGTTTADQDGKWMVKLDKLTASDKPIDVTVAGKNTVTFHDVLVGDVWLCSGQSNMQFGMVLTGAKADIAKANEPTIRMFSVPKVLHPLPANDVVRAAGDGPLQATWQVCTPDTLAKEGDWSGFPATAYYFGHNVQAFTHQPVGLIGSTWGGTPAQPWISLEGLQAVPRLQGNAKSVIDYRQNYEKLKAQAVTDLVKWKADTDKWNADNKDTLAAFNAAMDKWRTDSRAAQANHQAGPPKPTPPPGQPRQPRDMANNNQTSSAIFNGMIAPLVPYALKGAIWYQGESNAAEPGLYHTLMPALIADWRSHWAQGNFPFLIVQLPNFNKAVAQPGESNWAGTREAEAQAAAREPNTGFSVNLDLGEPGNIHPRDKSDVGYRLALVARHVAYGDDKVVSAGPTFKSMKTEGNKIRIDYDNVGGGLVIGHAPDFYYQTEAQKLPIPRPGHHRYKASPSPAPI